MISDAIAGLPIVVAGRGEADLPDKALFDRRAVAAVRYADPAAWVTAAAVARARGAVPRDIAAGERIGLVVSSAHGPAETIATVAEAAREGFPSPLRYPAANPGSLVGVTCILLGLRGPTMNLLASPAEGIAMGLFLAGRWVGRQAADGVFVAVCVHRAPGQVHARALLLKHETDVALPVAVLEESNAWLMSASCAR